MEGTQRYESISGVWEVQSVNVSSSIRDMLLLIPEYDGRPHGLENFAESVRHVASRVGDRVLLLALGGKLRSRARVGFAHRLHRYKTVEDFLGCLYAYFSGIGAEGTLMEELQRVRQKSYERVNEYGARVDKLTTQICAIYEAEKDEKARKANKKFVRDVALASFRRGFNNTEMEVRVATQEPETLDEAIRIAIAVENEMRSREKFLKEAARSEAGRKRRT